MHSHFAGIYTYNFALSASAAYAVSTEMIIAILQAHTVDKAQAA